MRRGRLYRGDACIIGDVASADRWWLRLRGLLLRPPLAADASEALLLTPCSSVHTIGMRYALDVVFLAEDGTVLSVRRGVRPWRAAAQRGARSTLELAAGTAALLQLQPGDHLRWQPA